MSKRSVLYGLCCVAALSVSPETASAQSPESFFKGKAINLYIGYAPGGGYDFFGRLVSRHIGKQIPGQPTVVPQNMPGAGSLRAANYVFNVAPRDGTALGIVTQTVALEEALGTPGVQYKAAEFNWIGRATSNVDLSIMWHTSKVKTIEDAFQYESLVSGTGPGSPAEVMPKLLNGLLGTKFRVIAGYGGSTEGMVAMERGETEGAITSWNTIKLTKQAWLQEKKINMILAYTPERHPDLPNVPAMVELGKTTEQKQVLALYATGAVVGRSIMASPEIPADRVKALRAAFDAMIKDAAFLDEIEKTKAEFDPLSGEKLQAVVVEAGKIPEKVRELARTARGFE